MPTHRSARPARLARLALATLAVACVVTPSTVSGAAASETSGPAGDTDWHPYRSDDIAYAAGERCAFKVTGTVVKDKEEYRNVNFWPNGKPRTQEFRGPLTIRWKNLASGRSVLRDQSGHAYLDFDRRGDLVALTALSGHFSAGLPKGSTPYRGIGYIGGKWSSVTINPDGTVTVSLGPHGTLENLCRTLAG